MKRGLFLDTNVWIDYVLEKAISRKEPLWQHPLISYSHCAAVERYITQERRRAELFLTRTVKIELIGPKLPYHSPLGALERHVGERTFDRKYRARIMQESRKAVGKLLETTPYYEFTPEREEIERIKRMFLSAVGKTEVLPSGKDLIIIAELQMAREIYNPIEIVSEDIHFTHEKNTALLTEMGFEVTDAKELDEILIS